MTAIDTDTQNHITTTIIGLLLIFLSSQPILAQSDADVQHIRKIYYQATADIKDSRNGEMEGPLYCTLLEINPYGKSWRAVGTYHVRTEFWYTDNPSIVDDFGEDIKPEHTLTMVIVTEVSAGRSWYREYLYDKGQVVFIYVKENNAPANEQRYYFKHENAIKIIAQMDEDTPSIDEMKKSARNHMDTFLEIMFIENHIELRKTFGGRIGE